MQIPDLPFRTLCVMARDVEQRLGSSAPPSDVIDELKWMLSRARIPYPPPDRFAAVVEAIGYARRWRLSR